MAMSAIDWARDTPMVICSIITICAGASLRDRPAAARAAARLPSTTALVTALRTLLQLLRAVGALLVLAHRPTESSVTEDQEKLSILSTSEASSRLVPGSSAVEVSPPGD